MRRDAEHGPQLRGDWMLDGVREQAHGGFVRFLKRFLENIEAWIYEAGIVVTNRRCETFHFVTNQLY